MPYYREQLLSAWSNSLVYDVGDPPVKIDPVILRSARQQEPGLWAPNPRQTRRNQVQKTRAPETNGSTITAPKFLSEKARGSENDQTTDSRASGLQDTLAQSLLENATKSDVPLMYRNVEIKYSRFGIEDFDFEFYNKTEFSGLETHIVNSYTNPLLQLLKFIPLFRNLALHHTATSCLNDTCLLCELGFLFDTLEKAGGQNCQATNFLKAFSSSPAKNMNLLEEHSSVTTLADMIQSACRFLLSQTADEYEMISAERDSFDQTLAVDARTTMKCVHCHLETDKSGPSYVTDLTYQANFLPNQKHRSPPTFSQVLKASVELQTQTRGWCKRCRRYQQLVTRRGVRGIPDVMMINTALKSTEARQYWAIPGWLPDAIGIIVENGKFFCFEGEDLRLHLEKGLHVVKVYDLVGVLVDVSSGEHQKPHLVSLVNSKRILAPSRNCADWL